MFMLTPLTSAIVVIIAAFFLIHSYVNFKIKNRREYVYSFFSFLCLFVSGILSYISKIIISLDKVLYYKIIVVMLVVVAMILIYKFFVKIKNVKKP